MFRVVSMGFSLAVLVPPLSAAIITVGPVACAHFSLASAVAAGEGGAAIGFHQDHAHELEAD